MTNLEQPSQRGVRFGRGKTVVGHYDLVIRPARTIINEADVVVKSDAF